MTKVWKLTIARALSWDESHKGWDGEDDILCGIL